MSREQVSELVRRLHDVQERTTRSLLGTVTYDDLDAVCPDGFTVQKVLRMWVWHFWTHHRDLVRARGSIGGDNPHFHVPHFVRQANEEFGRFLGELACLDDEQLDRKPPDGERTVRQVVEHVLSVLSDYLPRQARAGCEADPPESPPRSAPRPNAAGAKQVASPPQSRGSANL